MRKMRKISYLLYKKPGYGRFAMVWMKFVPSVNDLGNFRISVKYFDQSVKGALIYTKTVGNSNYKQTNDLTC